MARQVRILHPQPFTLIFIFHRLLFMEYKCQYCNETFVFDKKQQAGAHVTNCSMNPNKKSIINKILVSKNQVKNERILNCDKCGKEYSLNLTEHIFLSGDYRKHCSRICANSRIRTDEIKNKISNSIKLWNETPEAKIRLIRDKEKRRTNRKCVNCGGEFLTLKTSPKKYCSLKCAGSAGGKNSKQGKRSLNEIMFHDLCDKTYKGVLSNENIFNGWDADVILPEEKVAILWNGVWHYKKVMKGHSLRQVQNRDSIKMKEIKKMGYTPYVIKDMGGHNPKFVIEQFEIFKNYLSNNFAV
jgi:5-methylcytosine-specific restriction endonuclease McrA